MKRREFLKHTASATTLAALASAFPVLPKAKSLGEFHGFVGVEPAHNWLMIDDEFVRVISMTATKTMTVERGVFTRQARQADGTVEVRASCGTAVHP